MSTERTGGLSRRTWRAAVVVFLVVFLGGLGVSGSNALWSQSSQVTASVTTGTWSDRPQPGWAHPLDVWGSITDSNTSGHLKVRFTWSPSRPASTDSRVQYKLTLKPLDGGQVRSKMPISTGNARSADVWLSKNSGPVSSFRLTITPLLDGVAGEETERTVTVTSSSPWKTRSTQDAGAADHGTMTEDVQDVDTTPPGAEYTVKIR